MSGMARDDLDRRLAGMFEAASAVALPDGLLEDTYRVTRRIPQQRSPLARRLAPVRLWWSAPFGPAPRLRLVALVALLLLALASSLVYVGSHYRRLPPPYGPARNGLLVYAPDGQLVAVGPDGFSQRLDIALAKTYDPTFSRDGTKLAFFTKPSADPQPVALYVANPDGSDLRKVSGDVPILGYWLIAWSPDGTRIAFSSEDPDGGARIYVAAADGSGVEAITRDDGDSRTLPAWSPRGDRIAWRLVRHDSPLAELAIAAPDGSGEHTIATSEEEPSVFAGVQWSQDGSRLSYVRRDNGVLFAAIIDADGAHEQVVSDAKEGADTPRWSNDGTRIAYPAVSSRGAVIIDLASGIRTPIPAGVADCALAWSPDDQWLLGFYGVNCGHSTSVFQIPIDDVDHPIERTSGAEMDGADWQRFAP